MTPNWRDIIMHINRMGLSCAEIGRRIGVHPNTIIGLKNESWREPLYSLGAKLIDLERRLVAAGLDKRAA